MRNRYLEAFKESGNLLGLAGAAALSAALLNPVPLAIGVALELVYLAFVPDLKWYQARLSKLNDADIEKRREQVKAQVLPLLRPEMRERFTRLEAVRREIDAQSASDETWFREILRKLDFLLEKFLQFAGKEAQFREYLLNVLTEVRREKADDAQRLKLVNANTATSRSAPSTPPTAASAAKARTPAQKPTFSAASIAAMNDEDRWTQYVVSEIHGHYEFELAGLKELVDAEPDGGTRAVLEKRVEVLGRRRDFALKIGRIMTNLNHQLHLLEDTFGLISDEIRARPPEQVLADIEDVVSQTNAMTQTLEEMAPYEQMLQRIAA